MRKKKLIIFCTQLIFSGDGARAMTDLLEDIPFEVILAEHFRMPNCISNLPFLRVKNGDELKKILKKAEKRLGRACKALNENKRLLRGFHPVSRLLGLTQRPAFLKMEAKGMDQVSIDENLCSVCGRCVKECPAGNLYLENHQIRSKGICTLCYRCVNHCPRKAITVWINRRVTEQYHGVKKTVSTERK